MFVFPAFNSNYKTRKRTFKCCHSCRLKRVKCEITSLDYESVGCTNCRRYKVRCTLIKEAKIQQELVEGSKEKISSEAKMLLHQEDILFKKGSHSEMPVKTDCSSTNEYDRVDTCVINAKYLKEKFNFNISSEDKALTYQYVSHNHPKYIISNPSEDRSIWHESGVIVDDKRTTNTNVYKPYEMRDVISLNKSKYRIRSQKVYEFLLAIDAFKLSTVQAPFTKDEIRQLLDLYFEKINSIFPIVNEVEFRKDFVMENNSNVLLYAIILVISRDNLADTVLKEVFKRSRSQEYITDEEFYNDFVEFVNDLECKIRQLLFVLPQLGDNDKLTRLEVSLLLSLHFSFDNLGLEQSSHDLTDSINLALSLGIHMKRVTKDQFQKTAATNLWWCCYVFDRFNALVSSRSIFIRRDDFNADLPIDNIHLLKLVQLARSMENMYAIFKPFENSVMDNDTIKRYKLFNLDEFQRIEFSICEKEREANVSFYGQDSALGQLNYANRAVHFLSRIVNNLIIVGSQKAKYDDIGCTNDIPDAIASAGASNILWYHQQLKREDYLNIPLVPWVISLSMAVSLKKITKQFLTNKISSESSNLETIAEFNDYINELEQYSGKWQVVKEMCLLSRNFVNKIKSNHQEILDKRLNQNMVLVNKESEIPSTPSDVKLYKSKAILSTQNMMGAEDLIQGAKKNLQGKIGENDYYQNTFGNSTDTGNNAYNDYFESLHVDIFDNDFFRDLPNMVNFLD